MGVLDSIQNSGNCPSFCGKMADSHPNPVIDDDWVRDAQQIVEEGIPGISDLLPVSDQKPLRISEEDFNRFLR